MITEGQLKAFTQEFLERHGAEAASMVFLNHSYAINEVDDNTIYFGATDCSSLLVNDCVYWAEKQLKTKDSHHWICDDPGTLYSDFQDEAKALAEAREILELAQELEAAFVHHWKEMGMVVFPDDYASSYWHDSHDAQEWIQENCADQLAGVHGEEVRKLYRELLDGVVADRARRAPRQQVTVTHREVPDSEMMERMREHFYPDPNLKSSSAFPSVRPLPPHFGDRTPFDVYGSEEPTEVTILQNIINQEGMAPGLSVRSTHQKSEGMLVVNRKATPFDDGKPAHDLATFTSKLLTLGGYEVEVIPRSIVGPEHIIVHASAALAPTTVAVDDIYEALTKPKRFGSTKKEIMKPIVDLSMESTASDVSALISKALYEDEVPEGWTRTRGKSYDFPQDPELLTVFTVATKHLQTSSFGQELLEEWRDERDGGTMAEFKEDNLHGYLENFTGRNLTQLVKYYLSPQAIVDGAWLHEDTYTKDDGSLVAHTFSPPAFREHDGFIWVQSVGTGGGIAIHHDEL